MKCQQCGADLQDGVLFCRECGAKVIKKRFCRECGAELTEGAKFCSNCGATTNFNSETAEDVAQNDFGNEVSSAPLHRDSSPAKKFVGEYHENDSEIYSGEYHEPHRQTKKGNGATKKAKSGANKLFPLLGVFVILMLLMVVLGRNESKSSSGNDKNGASSVATEQAVDNEDVPTNYTITKGTEYAFMSDEWNVYIATAVSDSIIKLEHWDKTMSSTKKMSFSEDVGSFKINDRENGFEWLDDEHTAFTLIFSDKNNSRVKRAASHIFTINVSESDVCKGTDYDEKIACYTYTCDDWHMYRAIPLTEKFIKIECWSRSSSLGSFLFAWDWCVINIEDNDIDFEWTDGEHTSFTVTTQDEQNDYYWKKPEFVLFELENEGYKYPNVTTYLGLQVIGEDEAKAPEAASSYKYENYQDVQVSLEEAGFTNISTEIQYDIVLGLTDEGEVSSISIDGNTEFDKGDVFKKDVAIIITYHMKVEDDPEKQTESDTAEGADISKAETAENDSVSYSTNDKSIVKNGNTGVYSYKSRGSSYDIYYIIDFDEGYVYWFTDDNGDESCDRLKIESGDLNDVLIVTYHDGGDEWSNGLHFKYKNQPDHLIMEDNDHFEYDFYTTDLSKALAVREKKTIHDY